MFIFDAWFVITISCLSLNTSEVCLLLVVFLWVELSTQTANARQFLTINITEEIQVAIRFWAFYSFFVFSGNSFIQI